MNVWLKVALYSLIGAIIGSFLLGIISNGSNYGQGMPYSNSNSYYNMPYYNSERMPMYYGTNNGRMMGNGMGMMRQ